MIMKIRNVIVRFKSWIEINYIDIINEETIQEFAEIFHITEDEKEILRRRFL